MDIKFSDVTELVVLCVIVLTFAILATIYMFVKNIRENSKNQSEDGLKFLKETLKYEAARETNRLDRQRSSSESSDSGGSADLQARQRRHPSHSNSYVIPRKNTHKRKKNSKAKAKEGNGKQHDISNNINEFNFTEYIAEKSSKDKIRVKDLHKLYIKQHTERTKSAPTVDTETTQAKERIAPGGTDLSKSSEVAARAARAPSSTRSRTNSTESSRVVPKKSTEILPISGSKKSTLNKPVLRHRKHFATKPSTSSTGGNSKVLKTKSRLLSGHQALIPHGRSSNKAALARAIICQSEPPLSIECSEHGNSRRHIGDYYCNLNDPQSALRASIAPRPGAVLIINIIEFSQGHLENRTGAEKDSGIHSDPRDYVIPELII